MTTLIDWRKFDTALRLKYGDLREETITPPHIQRAIEDCSKINNSRNQWAVLNVVPTGNGPVVSLEIGDIHTGGFREAKIETRTYSLYKDEVQVYRHTHP